MPRIRTALGLHPQIAHQRVSELPLFEALLPETRYVGEVGLDGTPEFRPYWREQVQVFDRILQLSQRAGGRIMTIHSRRAASEVLDAVARHSDAGISILHWFSGSKAELERAVAMGCWFSVGPAMIASKRGRELVAAMPRNRVLTETDGPFGEVKRSSLEPGEVAVALDCLASLWGVARADADEQVVETFKQLVASRIGPCPDSTG
jgi:TatD DNase family protein